MTSTADTITDTITELAELCPALAAALERDTGGEGGTSQPAAAANVVNADVLAAMITLDHEIPAAVRAACDTVSEPWQHRDLAGCLRQIPRLASRLRDLGMVREEQTLTWQASGWLRIVKRALGLRKPDIGIGYHCPYTTAYPEQHADGTMLLAAGDEGFLRHGPDGPRVEWVHTPAIYCTSPDCDASWGPAQWPHLGRLLENAAAAS